MTAPDPDRLADAEEWARWTAVHDDWDKSRELMGVLLAEYDVRAARIAKLSDALIRVSSIADQMDAEGPNRRHLLALRVALAIAGQEYDRG